MSNSTNGVHAEREPIMTVSRRERIEWMVDKKVLITERGPDEYEINEPYRMRSPADLARIAAAILVILQSDYGFATTPEVNAMNQQLATFSHLSEEVAKERKATNATVAS